MPKATLSKDDIQTSSDGLFEAMNRNCFVFFFDFGTGRLAAANEAAMMALGLDAREIADSDIGALLTRDSDSFASAWTEAKNAGIAPIACGMRSKSGEAVAMAGHLTYGVEPDGSEQMYLVARHAQQGRDDETLELRGRAGAIDRIQAVVEFDLTGTVVSANDNFLALVGYSIGEVIGRQHRMFCEDNFGKSVEYDQFWQRLRKGEVIEGEFKRLGRGSREVWIKASYNPIMNASGKVTKVIEYATNVTEAKLAAVEAAGKLIAIESAQAVVEFDFAGTVLSANSLFLNLMGYRADDVIGQHHRIFCDATYANSPSYRQFWQRLSNGEFMDADEYKRVRKDGQDVWIQATYNPIFDLNGNPAKIVEFAVDITAAKQRAAEFEGKVNAINRAQAVIEFDLAGNILYANENFLAAVEYTIEEIRGRHHRLFVDPAYAASDEYRDFWKKLGRGEFEGGEYCRFSKSKREIWLQATYNPIFDVDGKPWKIIKYASDITTEKLRHAEAQGKVTAIDRAQGVIEFDLKGHVLHANTNFLKMMGVSLEAIRGKHHRIFCDPTFTQSEAYVSFWDKLGRGEFESGEYKRIGGGGREVWIQATYNPIFDLNGRPMKIVKFATDITEAKMRNVEFQSRVSAVDRGQAVIEFDTEGTIIAANENFLRVIGYSLRELVGQHHSILCSHDYTVSLEYRDFWLRLAKGEFFSGRFHRLGKFNRDVFIQATYSPIFNLRGEAVRVIKYAYDVTEQVLLERRIKAKSNDMKSIVDELSVSIQEITASTKSATSLATETQSNAEQGYSALNNAIEAIELIQRSSGKISDIVKVIGDIASQTNLLAFNAAIEAARAGEHGVGFSVVAGEVRRLAERSSQAAQEIAKLIDESVDRVEQGTDRSQHAKKAFEQIVGSVGKTGASIREIAQSASNQQSVSVSVAKLMGELTAQMRA